MRGHHAAGAILIHHYTAHCEREAKLRLDAINLSRQFDTDIEREPERIRRFYDIQRTRVEPVGLVYLWPESN